MDLFQKDKYFVKSFFLTFKYALMSVPMKLIMALIVAMILNMKLKGINFFRTIYYLPSIMGGSVAISILWRFMFMKDGMINKLLGVLHIPAVNWLGDPDIALVTISLLVVWQFGSSMVLFLAGLKNIPTELYEAASVDGANKWVQFWHVKMCIRDRHRGSFFTRYVTIQIYKTNESSKDFKGGKPNEGIKKRGSSRPQISKELALGPAFYPSVAVGISDSSGISADYVSVLFIYRFLYFIRWKMGGTGKLHGSVPKG